MIVCHPDNIEVLRRRLAANGRDMANGIPVIENPLLPKHPRKWVFPEDQFVEYDASDERWCRYFGFGHEVEDTSSLVFFKVNVEVQGSWFVR